MCGGANIPPTAPPDEAGLSRYISLDKGAFVGREAVLQARMQPPGPRLRLLAIESSDPDPVGGEPLFVDGKPIARLTSAAFGNTVGYALGFAYLPPQLDERSMADMPFRYSRSACPREFCVSRRTIQRVSSCALKPMKITAIRATPVNIPYHNPARMSAGTSGHSTRTIIEMETDAGLTGLGDASYAFAAEVIEREFAPALRGLDPAVRRGAETVLPAGSSGFWNPAPQSAPRRMGRNRYRAVGSDGQGRRRSRVPIARRRVRERARFVSYSYSSPEAERAPDWMCATARKAVDLTGAKIFEFKVGVHPLAVEREMIVAVHAALAGRAEVAVDANMALSPKAARTLLREVGALLENFEEPVESLRQMEAIGRGVRRSHLGALHGHRYAAGVSARGLRCRRSMPAAASRACADWRTCSVSRDDVYGCARTRRAGSAGRPSCISEWRRPSFTGLRRASWI